MMRVITLKMKIRIGNKIKIRKKINNIGKNFNQDVQMEILDFFILHLKTIILVSNITRNY